MKKYAFIVLIAAVLFVITVACAGINADKSAPNENAATEERLKPVNVKFDMKKPSDVSFALALDGDEYFVCLEGDNIASGDYFTSGNEIIIRRDYWTMLSGGEHRLKVITSKREKELVFDVNVENKDNQIVNGGFETGDLFGWTVDTVFKGEDAIQSFIDEGVVANDTFFTFEVPYGGVGKYVYGFDDRDGSDKDRWNERMGVMRSSTFVLGGSGYVSFMLGGGKNGELCYLSVRDAETDEELTRYKNEKFHSTSYILDEDNYYEANLVLYKADLSKYLGRKLFFEFVDMGGRDWDLLTFDEIVSYYATEPEDGILAKDVKPVFEESYVTNVLLNGDFSQGLKGFSQTNFNGTNVPIFTVSNGVIKSDAQGDAGKGMIRSSPFRVDGSGIISLNVGAAQGARFDKDTYISIKEKDTNRELFRFANRNHKGNDMITYYVDLSAHIGKKCYIEIVDNATAEYDVIFVSGIVTYYAIAPEYNFNNAAVNLAY